MVKCVFCGKEEHYFKGINLIGNDGNVNFFCSGKCRKNALKLKRDKRKLKWTEAHTTERHKTIAKDARNATAEEKKKSDKAAADSGKKDSEK